MPILLALPSSTKLSTALPRSGGQNADSPDERARLVQNVDSPGSVLPAITKAAISWAALHRNRTSVS